MLSKISNLIQPGIKQIHNDQTSQKTDSPDDLGMRYQQYPAISASLKGRLVRKGTDYFRSLLKSQEPAHARDGWSWEGLSIFLQTYCGMGEVLRCCEDRNVEENDVSCFVLLLWRKLGYGTEGGNSFQTTKKLPSIMWETVRSHGMFALCSSTSG